MDVNTLRSLTTLLLLGVFVGIWVWAWSGRQRDRFAEAAAIPLNDDEPSAPAEMRDRSRT
jgi:cytochrome c oxidase cbb3-type subunit 4